MNKPKTVSIPLHILWSKELNPTEKLIWADMNSFDLYYKSRQTIAEEFGMSESHVSRCMNKLLKLGYAEIVDNDGRQKTWRALMDDPNRMSHQRLQKCHISRDKNVTSPTEVETEVGDKITILEDKEKDNPPISPQGDSMNATSMRQELQRIFRVKNDPTKKQSLDGIKALQAELDDESILAAARSHKDVGVFTRKDGSTWTPDYFWFTNPRNTKAVVNWVVRRLADRNTEEEIDERTQAIVAWLIEHEYVESYDDYKKRQHALIQMLRRDEDFQNFIWEYDNRG